jgi:CDGSH-type Zn-finger protein/truncated hemoglobin YjbI
VEKRIMRSNEDEARIRVTKDGPYVLRGEVALVDHLGRSIEHDGEVRLCRCGQARTKPICDDACLTNGFTGAKDERRVPDRLDVHAGQAVTVYDNRGLCAHSGFCTDRLPGVFHLGSEPFVTPSGARGDDIVRAARRCPSGALGVGLDAGEDRHWTDTRRPVQVEVSLDGPYRVTGGVALVDEDGNPVERLEGASREHYSLCRCGSSLNKPFCSGMHWSVDFHDPIPDPEREPTVFEWAGGFPALLDMTRIFYSRHVPDDPLIGPLFSTMSPDHPERVAAWLSEVFGGPKLYGGRYGGYERMISQHVGKRIRPEQRARWVALMAASADEAGLPQDAEFRAAFTAYLEWGSRIAFENSQSNAKPPMGMPIPQWWWVCNATPGARVSALAPPAEEAIVSVQIPEVGEVPSFARHVKGLFRPMDRNSMKFAFDLWSAEDVATHGEAILARLKAGTMPCDGGWPADRVEIFEAWLRSGALP